MHGVAGPSKGAVNHGHAMHESSYHTMHLHALESFQHETDAWQRRFSTRQTLGNVIQHETDAWQRRSATIAYHTVERPRYPKKASSVGWDAGL